MIMAKDAIKINSSCPACKGYLSVTGIGKNSKVHCENCGYEVNEPDDFTKDAVKEATKKKE